MRHAKIVCTLGPSVSGLEKVEQLIDAGMDVARLNFSHGDHTSHRQAIEDVRTASRKLGKPIAILADLSGPKIRIGEVENGAVTIVRNQALTLTTESKGLGNGSFIPISYQHLPMEVDAGQSIYLDDGQMELLVQKTTSTEIHCTVQVGGILKSRKGLNTPNAGNSIPALTEKDERDLLFAKSLNVDYFALSFVRAKGDVEKAKALAGSIPVIAKIEKPAAFERLGEIAEVADGLMVARGDLGIEAGFEKVPLMQKQIIQIMNHLAKPVITATQMLESMTQSPSPTRAEVSDVANAVLDGTDAVMLSAETASGKFPLEAVRTMDRIIREVEKAGYNSRVMEVRNVVEQVVFENAVAHATARSAIDAKLKAVVVFSTSGKSIQLVSAYRPGIPIVGIPRDPNILNRLGLLWGIRPFQMTDWPTDVTGFVRVAERILLTNNLAKRGDPIAISFGLEDSNQVGTTMLKLWRIT